MMRRYHVETVCTTDDPVDSLEYHIKTRESGFEIKMLPTWRPDKAMAVEVPADFRGQTIYNLVQQRSHDVSAKQPPCHRKKIS